MQDRIGGHAKIRTYGPDPVQARARFPGQAATTINLTADAADAFGILSITQSSTNSGLFTVTLAERLREFSARVWITGEATRNHDCVVSGENFTAGTFTFQHYFSATDRTTTASATTAGNIANGTSPACVFHVEVRGSGSVG